MATHTDRGAPNPAPPGFPRALLRRAADPGFPAPRPGRPVDERDLEPLPAAAQRYLRFMGVLGRPRAGTLWTRCTGWFRRGPDARPMTCRTWQYNRAEPVVRLFRMRLRLAGPLAMTGWDTYRDGRGALRGTLLGVPVARGGGAAFDLSEQVTWLNDAVLMAPSMLLRPAIGWRAGDGPDAFRLQFTDAGRTVRAEVLLDANGAPRDFRTDDRHADLPGGPVRARWSTPVDGWTVDAGRPRFTRAGAVWSLPDGEFRYAELSPVEVLNGP